MPDMGTYRYYRANRAVVIGVPPPPAVAERRGHHGHVHRGGIHAIKGETHLATLVLETLNREHSLKRLMP